MRAITFFLSNIPEAVVKAQKSVFDHFDIEIEQVLTERTHGAAIDRYLNENEWESIAIFDIDCIPLHREVLDNAMLTISQVEDLVLYGAAQKANHLPMREIYCSPAFCCFSRELWEANHRATFTDIQWHDVGTFFSEEVMRIGRLELLYPSHVETPLWNLRPGEKFGLGTTYENEVYHAFQSRMNFESQVKFIAKCKEVIGG